MRFNALEREFRRVYKTSALVAQRNRCAYCAEPLTRKKATADHVVARRNGGVTKATNIKAACEPCNHLKGKMSETAFVRLIKNPQCGSRIEIWLAWSRRRIWMKTHRACERIEKSAA